MVTIRLNTRVKNKFILFNVVQLLLVKKYFGNIKQILFIHIKPAK